MTRGDGPRRQRDVERQEARRAQFADYCDRQMRDPTPGTTWHPLYRWPSDTDAEYAARVAEHERTQQTTHTEHDTTTGRTAG
ncbi:hypothetical protein O4159_12340 [Gordonia terrae]|uniref:hypothetical protein n=1 Tax=Gordonia hongkongensis TaxID=1701090 RepID=UPI0022B3FD6E|nr:hypothetical protein [Gordonia terrae]